MRIYTRGGDDGRTGLYGGSRVLKCDLRVDTYGNVDELNAVLGWVRAADPGEALDGELAAAQDGCLRLGAWLASVPGKDPGVAAPTEADVEAFEHAIDRLEEDLSPLTTFILPGGTELASRLHVARTVCRRAERQVVALATEAEVPDHGVKWLNRLSDLLFVQARHANHSADVRDVPWTPKQSGDA